MDDIVAANLKALLGKPENKPVYKPARPGEIVRLVVCYEKAKKELGWQPSIDLRQGLKKTLGHYKLT